MTIYGQTQIFIILLNFKNIFQTMCPPTQSVWTSGLDYTRAPVKPIKKQDRSMIVNHNSKASVTRRAEGNNQFPAKDSKPTGAAGKYRVIQKRFHLYTHTRIYRVIQNNFIVDTFE